MQACRSGNLGAVTETGALKAAVWLDLDQASLVRAVCERAGLSIVAAGSPQVGRSAEVAGLLGRGGSGVGSGGVAPIDDLRAALASVESGVVLIASPGEFAGASGNGGGEADDRGVLADCRARGVRIVTMEPMPASLLQIDPPALGGGSGGGGGMAQDGDPMGGAEWAMFCPLLRLSRAVREAADVIAQLGPLRTVAVAAWSGVGEGSLGARLYDAVDTVSWLLGEPESVASAFAVHARGASVHALPGQTLRALNGDLTASLRFSDGRVAGILASTRAGRWGRTLTLIGEGGRLRINDEGFEWIGPDGTTIDAARVPGVGLDDPAGHAAIAIADQLVRALDPRVPVPAPTDAVRVLATAGAALLSARTGEAESPATMLRMAGRV